ncbi:hypothetical protein Barb6XT_01048 [Bacteroidales bacterium Barb6XT]|nr:hypothetical protein Barb6XT_01048 [Bacteroidales bacterium Barb6XT]
MLLNCTSNSYQHYKTNVVDNQPLYLLFNALALDCPGSRMYQGEKFNRVLGYFVKATTFAP